MQVITTINKTKSIINEWKQKGYSIGFVPTMGYLHEGHKSLIEYARKQNDKVVVSIFVNPMQFGANEDLAQYPRDFDRDSAICESVGTDLIFHPEPDEMYGKHFYTFVNMSVLTEELCGLSRPTHFQGVCTVVTKLFHIVKPDRAYFGQKDAQQLAIIKQMVHDLNMDVTVIGCPIIREEDGLAKSSRNTYLSTTDRKAALILSQTIKLGMDLLQKGERNPVSLQNAMIENIKTEPLATVDYVKIVDALNMQPVDSINKPILAAIAVYIGKTRLIDNFIFEC